MESQALHDLTVKVIFPLVFYTFHGWLATAMAIWALFHPYNAYYFPFTKWQIPCTPGIFPKRRNKLSQAVATTITDTLLTTTDIKGQAENLVTNDNIYVAVDSIVDAVLSEFRDTEQLHRLAQGLSELSPALLQQLVISIVEGLDKGADKRISVITEKIFDQIVLSARISAYQADELADRLMESVFTPDKIRSGLVFLLTPQNINALEESIHNHASGPYRLLARIIGVKRVCYECRNFLEKDSDGAKKLIVDLLKRFSIRDQLANRITNFNLRSLPVETVAKIRQNLISFVETFLVEHREDILVAVSRIESESMGTVQSAIIKFNPGSIPVEWITKTKRSISAFAYAYLKRGLGGLLEKAIPALGIYGLIARKIDLFSPQQLEAVVKRICKQELKWLEYLGAFIGLLLGLIQVAVNFGLFEKIWQVMQVIAHVFGR